MLRSLKKGELVYSVNYNEFAVVGADQLPDERWHVNVAYLNIEAARYVHLRDGFDRAAMSFGGPVAIQSR